MIEKQEPDIIALTFATPKESAADFCAAVVDVTSAEPLSDSVVPSEMPLDLVWEVLESKSLRLGVIQSPDSNRGLDVAFVETAVVLHLDLFLAELRKIAADREKDIHDLSPQSELGRVWTIVDQLELGLTVKTMNSDELTLRMQFKDDSAND